MKIVAKTDTGKVRKVNQDCYNVGEMPDGTVWAVVCDGMGGSLGGDVASATAVKMISEKICSCYQEGMSSNSIRNILISSIESSNSCIYDMSVSNDDLSGMGTTVIAAIIADNKAHIAHVGDSRAYLISAESVSQITRDHSIVQAMVDSGQITQDEAKTHPSKNIITRALGVDQEIDIDFCEMLINNNDLLLFCTDGLTNYVENSQIFDLSKTDNYNQFADDLVMFANKNGGGDNITVVAIYG